MKWRWKPPFGRRADADAAGAGSGRRARVPTILQFEAVECGAASLAMILAHYGRWVPLEELRIACGVSRDGTKASNMLHAARSYGLEARGYRKEPEDLRSVRLPCVVFWNFNHFLVLEGFAGDWVHLNDPALGRRRVELEEFDQSFTGVVLTFEPTPEFRRGGEAPSILRSVLRRAAGMQSALVFLVVAGLASVVPGMVLPVFLSVFVDRVLVGNSADWLRPLLLGMALAALLRAVLSAIQNGVLLRLQTRLAVASAGRFMWHLLRLPVVFYTQRSAGEIGSRVQLNEMVARDLTGNVAGTCVSLLTAVFFGAVMLAYDLGLALIVILGAAAIGGSLWYVSQRTRELSQRVSIDDGKVQGTSLIGLAAMETIKSYGGEAGFFARWAGYQARLSNAMASTQRLSLPIALIPGFITSAVNVLVLGLGGARVIEGQISVGELVAFQSLAASFLRPVNEFVELASRFQHLQGSLSRLDDVLRYPAEDLDSVPALSEPAAAPAVHTRRRLEGFLELREVPFGYSRMAPPLIENLSLVATPGQRIALVGPSGCGKSTASRLIMGLYEPWNGEILFDGKPRGHWPREQLAASLAMVDQEASLFEGSYRDNLNLWDSTIAEEDTIGAAQDACIHAVIAARPGGYDGHLEQAGQNLSGGQRQRLEIARALAAGPRILVLDEATSALDVATEREVDRNLRRRGVTSIVIAHRLSTVRDADQIIVLDHGKVVERGSHTQLLEMPDGHYRRLVTEGMGT